MDDPARLGGHIAAIDELAGRPENWIDSHGTRFARHLVRRWRPAGRDETAEGVVHLAAFVAPPGTVESYRVMTEEAYDVLRLTDALPDPGTEDGGLELDHRGQAEERLDLKEREKGREGSRLTHLVQVIGRANLVPEQAHATDLREPVTGMAWRLLAFVVRNPAQRRALLIESLSTERDTRPARSGDD